MTGENFKDEGNIHFKEKRYKEALHCYDKAIAAEPTNVVFLNNRSAANYHLEKYEEAIQDARSSIKINSNAKGYLRMGDAFWAQDKYERALDAYDLALILAPNDASAKEKLLAMRNKIKQSKHSEGQTQCSTAPVSKRAAVTDIAIVLLSVLHVVSSLIFPEYAAFLYQGALMAMSTRQVQILQEENMFAFNLNALKRLTTHFSGQYALLILALIMLRTAPIVLVLVSISIYATLDLAGGQRSSLQSFAPSIEQRLAGTLQKAQAQREMLLVNAASCEIFAGFFGIFFGVNLVGVLIFSQFLRYRYKHDRYTQLAFRMKAEMAGKVFYHAMCPAIVGTSFTKLKDLLHRAAMN